MRVEERSRTRRRPIPFLSIQSTLHSDSLLVLSISLAGELRPTAPANETPARWRCCAALPLACSHGAFCWWFWASPQVRALCLRPISPLLLLPLLHSHHLACCLPDAGAQQQQTAAILRGATLPNGKLNLTAIAEVGRLTLPVSAGGSMDGSSDLKVPIPPTAIPRLQQILDEVVANASAKSGNRSFGQDTERAAAAGFVVRRGTQFFKDGKPY